MELASRGVRVDLYDKNRQCLSQASAQNEGKIHLGYVYANDRSLRTARTMLKGAISFAGLLRRWVGCGIDRIPVSTPFYYVVHAESLLAVDQIEHHLRSSHEIAIDEGRGAEPDYFGADYRVPPEKLSRRECDLLFDRQHMAAAYRTQEMGIDPEALAPLVRARLSDDPGIQCVLNARVSGVAREGNGLTIDFDIDGSRGRERYDHVVNALWDGRLAVDKTFGVSPRASWLFRIKHYLRVRTAGSASGLPSATIILGAFGDIVAYGNGEIYLSWYPAGMRGASRDLSPPAWPFELDRAASDGLRKEIVEGLETIVPSVGRLGSDSIGTADVRGGIIFAWGKTDIHDPASGLHQRHAIGPQSFGQYHTIDTGKLTMAPLFGKIVADRIRSGC
jgi:hypothetical protein